MNNYLKKGIAMKIKDMKNHIANNGLSDIFGKIYSDNDAAKARYLKAVSIFPTSGQ